jgi:dTDP-4-dehydrorhamnose reductase
VARTLATLAGREDAAIIASRFADAVSPVCRPQYAALSNDKLRRAGVEMPAWDDALRRYVAAVRR